MGLTRMFTPSRWARGWSGSSLRSDVAAGLTVTAVLVPTSMAYAHVAGLPAQVGLYAATIPVVLYALFGLVPSMSIGPIATAALLTGIALGRAPTGVDAAELAAAIAVLCAIAHVIVMALKLDRLVGQISRPALLGFVTAVGVLTIGTQFDSFLGLVSDHPRTLWGDIEELFDPATQVNWWSALIASITVGFVMMLGRGRRWVPAGLIAVISGIVVDFVFDLESHGVVVVGTLPSGLPGFQLPSFSGMSLTVLVVVVGIVVISQIEMSVIGRNLVDEDIPFEPRQETIALAVSSAGAGLFRGMPVAGGPGRSALAEKAGARTPLTAVVTGSAIMVLLLVGSTWLAHLPLPVAAALVVVAGIQLIKIGAIRELWQTDRGGAWIAVAGLIVGVVNIEAGVVAVVVLSVVDSRRSR